MNIFDSIIQGIVQGLTEFLPVSSSGHLAITQHILGVTENNLFFNVMLHVGTLVAVCFFYRKLILSLIKELVVMVKDIFTGNFKWKSMNHERKLIMMLIIGLLPLFALFIPIPFTGGVSPKDLADILMESKYFIVVAISLLVTSALLAVGIAANNKTVRRYKKKGIMKKSGAGRQSLNPVDALCVGIMQCVAAVFPGVSRSGSTLAVGELRGLNKQTALDYTFVLGIPSILAAALLETKDAITEPNGISVGAFEIIIGMAVSAVVGYFAIVLFKWLLKTDKMYVFVIYTAIVGLVMLIISLIELSSGANVFTGASIY